jgi:hypothetical protein
MRMGLQWNLLKCKYKQEKKYERYNFGGFTIGMPFLSLPKIMPVPYQWAGIFIFCSKLYCFVLFSDLYGAQIAEAGP